MLWKTVLVFIQYMAQSVGTGPEPAMNLAHWDPVASWGHGACVHSLYDNTESWSPAYLRRCCYAEGEISTLQHCCNVSTQRVATDPWCTDLGFYFWQNWWTWLTRWIFLAQTEHDRLSNIECMQSKQIRQDICTGDRNESYFRNRRIADIHFRCNCVLLMVYWRLLCTDSADRVSVRAPSLGGNHVHMLAWQEISDCTFWNTLICILPIYANQWKKDFGDRQLDRWGVQIQMHKYTNTHIKVHKYKN